MSKQSIHINKVIVHAILILSAFYSNFSYGDSVSGYSIIEKIQPLPGGIYIHLATGNNDSENCGGSPWSYLVTSTTNYSVISATVLSAFTTKVEVNLYNQGCTGGWTNVIGLEVK